MELPFDRVATVQDCEAVKALLDAGKLDARTALRLIRRYGVAEGRRERHAIAEGRKARERGVCDKCGAENARTVFYHTPTQAVEEIRTEITSGLYRQYGQENPMVPDEGRFNRHADRRWIEFLVQYEERSTGG
jgi:hypothetical protein